MSLQALFGYLSYVAVLGYNLSQLPQKRDLLGYRTTSIMQRFSRRNPYTLLGNTLFWAVIETLVISVFQYALVGILNTSFGDLVGTGANYYGLMFSSPILVLAACLLFGVNPLKQMDLIAPSFPFALIFVKISCFCTGCCGGIECDLGIYSEITGRTEFPIQLLESAVAMVLFVVLVFWADKIRTGTVFPAYLMLYSGIRFLTEFLRHEPAILWGLKRYHFLCIAGLIVGAAEYAFVLKFGNKISSWFREKTL